MLIYKLLHITSSLNSMHTFSPFLLQSIETHPPFHKFLLSIISLTQFIASLVFSFTLSTSSSKRITHNYGNHFKPLPQPNLLCVLITDTYLICTVETHTSSRDVSSASDQCELHNTSTDVINTWMVRWHDLYRLESQLSLQPTCNLRVGETLRRWLMKYNLEWRYCVQCVGVGLTIMSQAVKWGEKMPMCK